MLDWIAGWLKNLLAIGAVGLCALGTYLYTQQRTLIYAAHFPPDSRQRVERPDEHDLSDYDDVKLRTPDGLTLHAYFIRGNQDKIREISDDGDKAAAWTVLYCHANAGII